MLSVWGEELREADVPAVSILAGQVAASLEVARLYRRAEQAAVMEERTRLARELHDSMTQLLYRLTLFAEAGRRAVIARDLARAEEYLARMGENALQALREMRLLVYHLRPSALRREGLVGALQHRLNTVEKRAGMDMDLRVEGALKLSS